MSSVADQEIIELTDVLEEGHPDRPNLPPQAGTESYGGAAAGGEVRAGPGAPEKGVPGPAAASPMDAETLSRLLDRLENLEQRAARLENLDQDMGARFEARMAEFARDTAAARQEQFQPLLEELRSGLEQQFAQALNRALEAARSRTMEDLCRDLAANSENLSAQMESRFEAALAREEELQRRLSDALAARAEEIHAGLLQELERAVPAAAARILREEIQALSGS